MFLFGNKLRELSRPYVSVVVVAAGNSTRMGEDKLFIELCGAPILAHTLTALNRFSCVDEIVVVSRPDKMLEIGSLCQRYGIYKVTKILLGGETRTHSALAGVLEVSPRAKLIGIHDGARPFISEEIVEETVRKALYCQAAAPGVPVTDTVKLCNDNVVQKTLPRAALKAIQTPQVFQSDLIKGALTAAIQNGFNVTDDCSAVEALGIPVCVIPGDPENIKITTPMDLELAKSILAIRGIKG